MLMHKSDPAMEAGVMPGPEVIQAVGQMVGQLIEANVLLAGDGLRQTALGVRLDFAGGRRTVTRGPFTGDRELTAALCIVAVRSIDEAVEWATRFAAIVGDVQIDIRPLTEAWDLGHGEKPAGQLTTRYMLVVKADRRYESGEIPTPAITAAVRRLIADMKEAGVYQSAHLLRPSREARRIRYKGSKATVTDGPFAESKELIAGFVLLNVESMAAAAKWGAPYAAAVGDIELDVRPLVEADELD